MVKWRTKEWEIISDADDPEKFELLLDWLHIPHTQDVEELYQDGVMCGTRVIVGYWATYFQNDLVMDTWNKHLENG